MMLESYYLPHRNCLFHDESKTHFGDLYSYSACIVKCRIQTMQSLCRCTPFYLPTDQRHAICTINDLRCLNKHKEKFLYIYPKDSANLEGLETEVQESLYCPKCLPDCELTQHSTKYSKIPIADQIRNHKLFRSAFFRGLNMTNKCLLSIYQPTNGVLNRLDVVSYWFEILSNVGGFCGVLLGFSILSLLELTYFSLIRFPANALQFYFEDDK